MKKRKRMGYLRLREEITLTKRGLKIWCYNSRGDFVGRLEINRAGVEPFVGTRGQKSLGNMSWERFFKRLAKKR